MNMLRPTVMQLKELESLHMDIAKIDICQKCSKSKKDIILENLSFAGKTVALSNFGTIKNAFK